MRLAGKVAVVTGSGQGIGKAMAVRMAAAGAAVVVNGRDPAKIENVVNEIRAAGGTAMGRAADVSKRSEVRALVDAARKEFGAVDILVNNAIARRRSPSFLEMTDEDWDIVLATGLKGTFNCIQAVAPQMMERRYGKIINISSTSAMGSSSGPGEWNANYAATKAGIIQLTRTFAREFGPYGINVNCISPGSIQTAESFTKRSPEAAAQHTAYRAKLAVLGRMGKPEEIANLTLFLASDESSFITGQTITADGGRTDYMS
jgi:NAD(P)-dependent dehydrogenase (short-subunit alcohol dehydrogenase family)